MKELPNDDTRAADYGHLVDAWVSGEGVKERPLGTQRAYRRAIRLWLEFLQGGDASTSGAALWVVNSDMARAWRDDLLIGKRNKPATINQLISSVSSFYKFAISKRLAPEGFRENPFDRRALRLRVNAYDKARVLTSAEYRQLMKHLGTLSNTKTHLRAHAMIRILLHTGWRARELLVMRAGDLKPTSYHGGGMRYRCEMPDGSSFVDHLPADCTALMEEYLEVAGRPFETLAADEFIWSSVRPVNMAGLGIDHGMVDAVQTRSVLRMARTYLRDAGIDDYETIRLPDLRHTHAAILHEGGATIETISKRMRFERKESAERFAKSVLSAGEIDDVSAYFQAIRKEPTEKNSESPIRQYQSRKQRR